MIKSYNPISHVQFVVAVAIKSLFAYFLVFWCRVLYLLFNDINGITSSMAPDGTLLLLSLSVKNSVRE